MWKTGKKSLRARGPEDLLLDSVFDMAGKLCSQNYNNMAAYVTLATVGIAVGMGEFHMVPPLDKEQHWLLREGKPVFFREEFPYSLSNHK